MSRQSVGINVGINKTEKAVLEILIRNPKKTAEEIAIEIESTVFQEEKHYVKNLFRLPWQDVWTTSISQYNGADWGKIVQLKKVRLPKDYF